MIVLITFAFLAGIVTILSPCILPMLPVILSGSAGGGKARPWGIVTGFVVSFTFFTLTLSLIVKALGISADILRYVAAGLVIAFGLVMIIPALKKGFMLAVSRLTSRGATQQASGKKRGYLSGVALGASLGLLWTPCVGPIMASVISLAFTASVDAGSVFITLAYSLGTAVPLLAIMLGGRGLLTKVPFLTKHSNAIQKGFGVLMLATGILIITGWDRQFQTAILSAFPGYGAGLTSIEDQEFIRDAIENRTKQPGPTMTPAENNADESTVPAMTMTARTTPSVSTTTTPALYDALLLGGPWLNVDSLEPASLLGKVVMIDFWTYSCINCIRTLPYLTAWDERYRKEGLVIIGVHSPEFAFERETGNVRRAIADFHINYAVVQDNEFKIWKAFNNHFWPAHYFFDRSGKLVSTHIGEGKYDDAEKLIQTLLGEASPLVSEEIPSTYPTALRLTPETYLGSDRAENFASPEPGAPGQPREYSVPRDLATNHWALSGTWVQEGEYIRSVSTGALELAFYAQNVYLVLGPVGTEKVTGLIVSVDGRRTNTPDVRDGMLSLDGYRLYQLYAGDKAASGRIRIEVPASIKAFAFTFG